MAPELPGAADGRRMMDLLWGREQSARTRGPKPALDPEQIVRAAIELADAEGLEAVSMRRVAERLGAGAMSLYTYIPGKAELLELMLDRVLAEPSADAPEDAEGWRSALEQRAREMWRHYQRHPWTLQVSAARATLGPNELASYQRALATVVDLGLPARETVAMVDALAMFVRGAAQQAAEAERAAEATGKSETDWWYEREATLTEVMADHKFPVLDRLGAEGGFDVPEDEPNYNLRFALDDFEFGLQRLLDGFEAHVNVAKRRREPALD
jgi:AcrR family transcriptional regulator